MTHGDFYDIAEYGNKNWKGDFTAREIACNAYDYFVSFTISKINITSKLGKPTPVIISLLENLDEDILCDKDNEEAKKYANLIRESLGLNHAIYE